MAKKASTPKPAAAKPASNQSAALKAAKLTTTKTTEKPTKANANKVPKYSQGGVIGETRSSGGPTTIKSRGTGPDEVKKPE